MDESKIKKHLLESYFDQVVKIYPSVIFFSLIVMALFWNSLDSRLLLAWLFAGFVIDFIYYKYRSSTKNHLNISEAISKDDYAGIVRNETLLLFISSLRWAFAGFMFYVPKGFVVQALIYAIIFGIISGYILFAAFHRTFFYVLAIPILLAIAARLLLSVQNLADAVFFIVALLLFYITSFRILKYQEASYVAAAKLKFDNVELIEDLSKAKEAAEKANRHKSSFLAAASHDLRQPVQSLRFLVDALKNKTNGCPNQSLVDKIDRSSSSLFMLLDNLLDISKLDAGVVKYNKVAVSVVEIFEQIKAESRLLAANKNLEFTVEPIDEYVNSDPSLLYRILSNLVDNAIKYTDGGKVTLSAKSKDSGTVVFIVSDTGIGIPADKQNLVFEEFQQLDNPARDREKSLGLGLSICRRMVSLLKHKITLSSEMGQGTTVSIEVAKSKPVKKSVKEISEITMLPGKNILVIDDEKDVLESLRIILESWQANVFTAERKQDVMMIIKYLKKPLDLIICDYRLKDAEDGLALIGIIKNEIGRNLPAIILTGDVAKPEIAKAESDNLKVLAKPVASERLNTIMVALLKSC